MKENQRRLFEEVLEKTIKFTSSDEIPLYEARIGYGCVDRSYDIIERNVALDDLSMCETGLVMWKSHLLRFQDLIVLEQSSWDIGMQP